MSSATASHPAPRRRPRDRKRLIEEAAASAFAERGYHGVSMQDIATAVGISAPALYRHFPNKYALFTQTVFALAHSLVEATDDVADDPQTPEDARAVLESLLDVVIATTIDLRATGGIYRWEGRYLERDDRDRLTAEFRILRGRFERAHAIYRPELSEVDRSTVVLGALSAVASVTAHRTTVAVRTLRTQLAGAAWRALDASIAPDDDDTLLPTVVRDTSHRRDLLLEAAIDQFAVHGYNDATIEDIAAAADLTPSGVYRHFEGKGEMLLAVSERAALELERATRDARTGAASPREAMQRLCVAYVAHTFGNLPLMRVYFADLANLPPDQQRRLRAMQRAHIAAWVSLLQGARPELGQREAAVLVHAGLSVVADQAPLVMPTRSVVRRLAGLVEAVLGVA
ncbi:TetR/AcrR family transcriptional regulator [Microbacterium sediminicola]|uniref:TetR/AcrR family transcriptional regulator n=1 Tax=Microbacterium sediminicola TaxID=415210 RepID=A0ABN2I9R2_9MICO